MKNSMEKAIVKFVRNDTAFNFFNSFSSVKRKDSTSFDLPESMKFYRKNPVGYPFITNLNINSNKPTGLIIKNNRAKKQQISHTPQTLTQP